MLSFSFVLSFSFNPLSLHHFLCLYSLDCLSLSLLWPCVPSVSVLTLPLGSSLLWSVLCSPGVSPGCPGSLQMDVVSAFQSASSFQGVLRRQASNSSQPQHDVTNVSSPSHVTFSTTTTTTPSTSTSTTTPAINSASATVGCECVFSSSA